jgi:branched-chain amino acid aminotransferase
MLLAEWTAETGWGNARIVPRDALRIDPAAVVFHYGQAVFEAFKAHRQPDARLALFRVWDHAARLVRSTERMAIPPIPPELFVALLSRFVAHQAKALPDYPGLPLYIRPVVIGTEAGLGIRASSQYLLFVLLSPVAPYFAGRETAGLRVLVMEDFVRASAGGTGAIKAAGNYGRSLLGLSRAKAIGCDQVIWLDARERTWVEEMEGMNVLFVRDGALVTPPTGETILAGITRDSLLTIARDEGIGVREESIRADDLLAEISSGRITEAFAAGTAAVIAPIAEVVRRGETARLPKDRPIATQLLASLSAVQSGRAPDPRGWRLLV